jgi:hypothetical protein
MAFIKTRLNFEQNNFERELKLELVKQVNKAMFSVANSPVLRNTINEIIEKNIISSPEYQSLLNGKLAGLFGLDNPDYILSKIIQTVKNSVLIETRPAIFSSVISAGITVSLLPSDFSDVLSIEGVSYDSKGGAVDWLKWLLTAGDTVVVVDYDVVFGNAFVGSRSDFAIMERNVGQGFSVPPEYSGTAQNNWLTRSLEDVDKLIGNILILELNKVF